MTSTSLLLRRRLRQRTWLTGRNLLPVWTQLLWSSASVKVSQVQRVVVAVLCFALCGDCLTKEIRKTEDDMWSRSKKASRFHLTSSVCDFKCCVSLNPID